jgi:UDP-2,3-diacylglucosamine hydrolase
MPCTLFISDLHLDAGHPAATQLLLQLLGGRVRQAEALYILGDLFEAWIGDDDDSALGQTVGDALRACTASGTPVFIMHGNRDFLLGAHFVQRSGATLLEDPAIIDLYGTPVLLTHGDLLCTEDTQYQAYRQQVRDPRWQEEFLARPLAERRRLAAEMRDASHAAKHLKPEAIMDVSSSAVTALMRRHGVTRLIHGHTHRPAIHEFELDGAAVQRMVLGDWYAAGSLLECTPQGCRLESPLSVQ